MIKPWDYQRELLGRLWDALADPAARIMMQLPTSGGKTHVAGELLSSWLKNGRTAIWLTHRRELAAQTERMLREAEAPATANSQWAPGARVCLHSGIAFAVVTQRGRMSSRLSTASLTAWNLGSYRGIGLHIHLDHQYGAMRW